MNYGKLWTKEEELQLIDEIADKKEITDIANSHGRTVKAINMRVENLIVKQYREKYTLSSLMNLYNKSEEEIRAIIKKNEIDNSYTIKQNSPSNFDYEKIMSRLDTLEKYIVRIYKMMDKKK
jgi:hypothetical protein